MLQIPEYKQRCSFFPYGGMPAPGGGPSLALNLGDFTNLSLRYATTGEIIVAASTR